MERRMVLTVIGGELTDKCKTYMNTGLKYNRILDHRIYSDGHFLCLDLAEIISVGATPIAAQLYNLKRFGARPTPTLFWKNILILHQYLSLLLTIRLSSFLWQFLSLSQSLLLIEHVKQHPVLLSIFLL